MVNKIVRVFSEDECIGNLIVEFLHDCLTRDLISCQMPSESISHWEDLASILEGSTPDELLDTVVIANICDQ
jgi:hypothetical protein